MCKSSVDGLPNLPPRMFYVRDFDTIETVPAYRQLSFAAQYRLAVLSVFAAFYGTEFGRIVLNGFYWLNNFIAFYFPYNAMFRFGFKKAFVNMFYEDPKDDTTPKPNAEYRKPHPPATWFSKFLTILGW